MDDVVEYAFQQIEQGSKSFASALRLFPPATRADVAMLYAWCRHCDDSIDGQTLGYNARALTREETTQRLVVLRHETERALTGTPNGLPFTALHRVITRHRIPHHHAIELLDGMAIDAESRQMETLDDTLTYSYHVAGVVGVMMAMIMGVRDRATLERASDLGIAFQLTNIARDVIPDATVGRVYLPQDWLARQGIETATLTASENRLKIAQLTQRLLNTADAYYASAALGVERLPFRSAWAVGSAQRIYSGIGHVVRRRGHKAWDTRARVPKIMHLASVLRSGAAVAFTHARGSTAAPKPRDGLWTPDRLGTF